MIFCLFADFMGENPQTILNLQVALLFQIALHMIQAIKKLKQPHQTADDLYFQKALLLGLILSQIVISFRHFSDDEHHFLYLEGYLQILFLYFHEHPR